MNMRCTLPKTLRFWPKKRRLAYTKYVILVVILQYTYSKSIKLISPPQADNSREAVNCHSFNFIPNRGDKGSGRCELINSEAWFPGNFVTRLADSASQFFVKSTYLRAYYFQIIPAVHGGNANPSIRVSTVKFILFFFFFCTQTQPNTI
jgi:hypothetical protein